MCQRLGLLCAFVMSMVFLFFGRNLFALFSDEAEILDIGVVIMRILCFVIYMQISQVVFFGCLRGAGGLRGDPRYLRPAGVPALRHREKPAGQRGGGAPGAGVSESVPLGAARK